MKIFIYRVSLSFFIFVLVGCFSSKCKADFCNTQKETILEVLASRNGNPVEYSENITTGIAFLLSTQCDTALIYFNTALQIKQTPQLAKLISDIKGGSKSISILPTATQPADKDSHVLNPENTEQTSPNSASSNSEESESSTNEMFSGSKAFSDDELGAFQAKGLLKIKKLMSNLEVIAQKSTPQSTATSTIENTIGLFDNENRIVQVTSTKTPGSRDFPIRTYLTRLRMLNYQKVEIESAAFTYVRSFVLGPDGNYYGVAKFRQSFTGYRENKPYYSDITTKTVAVVLKPYQKAVDGKSIELWDVFLGDISVSSEPVAIK